MSLSPKNTSFDSLKEESVQSALTQEAETALFQTKQNALNTTQIINEFVQDYLTNGQNQPIQEWLLAKFSQYQSVWENESEKNSTAHTIIQAVDVLAENYTELKAHRAKGKTLANFVHKKTQEIADNLNISATDIGQAVENQINQANQAYTKHYTGQALELLQKSGSNQPLEIARNIVESAKINSQLNSAWWGLKTFGENLLSSLNISNAFTTPALKAIMTKPAESPENKGIQIAVSGAMAISAKEQWIKTDADLQTQLPQLVLDSCEGWFDTRLLEQLESNALTTSDYLAERTQFAVTKTLSVLEVETQRQFGMTGEQIGRSLGTYVGNPMIGAIVGKTVGQLAGQILTQEIFPLLKRIAHQTIESLNQLAKKAFSTLMEGVRKVVKTGQTNLTQHLTTKGNKQ